MLDYIQYGPIYSCRYFENKDVKTRFPKLQFVTIDNEEVIFASSSYTPNLYSIKGKEVVDVFLKYFDQAWNLAIEIKVNDKNNETIANQIKCNYS